MNNLTLSPGLNGYQTFGDKPITVTCGDCGTQSDLWPEEYEAEGIEENDGDWFCEDCQSKQVFEYDTYEERDL